MGITSENKDFDYYSNRLSKIEDLQLANMWVIQFSDDATGDMDMYITDTNIPLRNIELGTTTFNSKYADSYKELSTYTLTVLETENFRNYKYFNNWLKSIYDFENKVFKKNFVYKKRKAQVKFISIKNPTPSGHVASVPMIGLPAGISNGTIRSINKTSQNIVQKIFKSSPVEPIVYKNAIFELQGVLITGMDDLTLDVTTGDPLSFTVNLEIENIIPMIDAASGLGNRQIS
jgi:hypothetical protein